MYKVIRRFHDLKDETKTKAGVLYHEYNVGDVYPRKGFGVSEERLEELSGNSNKQGKPLIELVEDENSKPEAEKPETDKRPAKKTVKNTADK